MDQLPTRRKTCERRLLRGPAEHRLLVFKASFPADTAQMQRVRARIHRLSRAAGLSEDDAADLALATDEAIANIIEHAYGGNTSRTFQLVVARGRGDVAVVLEDSGEPFDLRTSPPLDFHGQLAAGKRGSLGIYLIRNLVDGFTHSFDGARNRLVLVRGPRP